jgi:hypothetical protein
MLGMVPVKQPAAESVQLLRVLKEHTVDVKLAVGGWVAHSRQIPDKLHAAAVDACL